MKKLKKLSLNQLSKTELENREMDQLLGGGIGECGCGCNYVASYDNTAANTREGLTKSA